MYTLILHGRSSLGLQKLCILRFAANPFQNASAFSSSFSTSTRDGQKGQNFTVSYLVGSLGLTTKLAESISRKVSFEEKVNPDSVLNLLRSHGFRDSQISSIITDYPLLLIEDAEKSLAPKLRFLQSRGASSSELTETLSKVPKILGLKEDKAISVYYDFVKEIIEANKSFSRKKLCHSSLPQGSRQENKLRNVLVLRELGVPQEVLFPLLISDHPLVCGKGKFEESLKKVVEMGFDPKTSKFLDALRIVQRLSHKTLEGKVDVYKRLGFTVGEIWEIFRKLPVSLTHSEKKILNAMETFLELGFSRSDFVTVVKRFPQCLGSSGESLKKRIEFVVKQMEWPVKAVVSNPAVLGLSMEKRIVPRCNVIVSKGLLGDELPPISSVLKTNDQVFLNKYVMNHDGMEPELMAIFKGERVSIDLKALLPQQ